VNTIPLSYGSSELPQSTVELGRYRYFRSVSVFGIFLGIFQSRYRYFKISRYRYFFWTIRPTILPRSLSCPGFQTISNAVLCESQLPTEAYNSQHGLIWFFVCIVVIIVISYYVQVIPWLVCC